MDIPELTLDPSGQDKSDSNDSEDHHLVQGEEDGSGLLVNSQGGISLESDGSGQYHFRADTGQGPVTYRVVQVSQGEDGQTQIVANPQMLQEEGIEMLSGGLQNDDGIQVINPAALQQNTQVLHGGFNNGGGSPNDPLTGDGRFTYITAGGAGDVAVSQSGDVVTQAGLNQATLGQVTSAGGGQFYVMMSPQDVLQATGGQRVIAPRSGVSPRVDGNRNSRDERRRASHNEVERRRRDKMNEWIVHLSKMVPDCAQDNNKMMKSKGGILAKACEYINELRSANEQMTAAIKEAEKMSVDNDLLRSQIAELKNDNAMLVGQLHQHGIILQPQDDSESR